MQQQQKQENQHSNISSFNENEAILQNFINLLSNKQRKPTSQIKQINNEDENHFDSIIEYRENGSHLSQQQSTDTYQTYISINIQDYEAQILKKILQNQLREIALQKSDYEKNVQVHSDLQYQQFCQINDPKQSSNSDIIQLKQAEDSTEESNYSTQKKQKKKEKLQNEQELLRSFRNFRQRFQRYLKEFVNDTKKDLQSIRGKIQQKYLKQQVMMKEYRGFIEQIREVIEETQQIIQEYDKHLQEKNYLFQN
ncbi:unnamed protein product [Paramecium primaurelia]|uniref:Uncharacterized protein n=1 Tax=Paramecium primaurelia TaxID=5886 RepID=A0A8S1KYY6_PARPR|nr:unnamed protein product [Paramecium primaurelia]